MDQNPSRSRSIVESELNKPILWNAARGIANFTERRTAGAEGPASKDRQSDEEVPILVAIDRRGTTVIPGMLNLLLKNIQLKVISLDILSWTFYAGFSMLRQNRQN